MDYEIHELGFVTRVALDAGVKDTFGIHLPSQPILALCEVLPLSMATCVSDTAV